MSEGGIRDAVWPAVHAERAALADDLAGLDDAQWAQPSLCGRWVIEEVVAHLTAAASIGPGAGPPAADVGHFANGRRRSRKADP
jgi:uncharacterized protein (TIGR03083 family)